MKRNLINERKKLGFTQAELAIRLRLTDRHYQSLEAGTSDGSVRVWQDLSKLFGKTINYLIDDADNTKEPDGNQAK